MADDGDLKKLINHNIKKIAATISEQQLGLAPHRPEEWAVPVRCFENARRKAAESGGSVRFGWTFHHWFVDDIPGPGYLYVNHHAVWHAPDGKLIDVTPYPEQRHRPLPGVGDALFLVDDKAQPVRTAILEAPLPMRFFALSEDMRLINYVKRLNREEQKKCKEIYCQKDRKPR